MKLVRDHRSFGNRLRWNTTEGDLRALFITQEYTEPLDTSDSVGTTAVFETNKIAVTLPVTAEMVADSVPMKSILKESLNSFIRVLITRESVELNPSVTRDDAAAALWQAANTVNDMRHQLKEANAKIERMQATAQAMFGGVDESDVAELLGIRTEW